MAAMYSSGSKYDVGKPSGSQSFSGNPAHGAFPMPQTLVLQQMPFLAQMPLMNNPLAFVSQTESGTYNNFKGNNFKLKGIGKKFYYDFQQPHQAGSQFSQQCSLITFQGS